MLRLSDSLNQACISRKTRFLIYILTLFHLLFILLLKIVDLEKMYSLQ